MIVHENNSTKKVLYIVKLVSSGKLNLNGKNGKFTLLRCAQHLMFTNLWTASLLFSLPNNFCVYRSFWILSVDYLKEKEYASIFKFSQVIIDRRFMKITTGGESDLF